MMPVNILLVDDNAGFLKAAHDYLAGFAEVRIAGTARSGRDAIQQAEILKPDIVFMDVSMPGISGFEATRRLKRGSSPPHVVMLAIHDSLDNRCHAAAAGADAYLHKQRFVDEVLNVIGALAERRSRQGPGVVWSEKKRPSI